MHLRNLVATVSFAFFAAACGGTLEESAPQEPMQGTHEEAREVQAFGTCTVACNGGGSVSCTATTCTASDAGQYVECGGVRTYCFNVSISKSGTTLTANVSGGVPAYQYKWSYYRVCSGGPVEPVAPTGPVELREPCNTWMGPYSGGNTFTYSYTDRIYKVTVTDSVGNSKSAQYGGLD